MKRSWLWILVMTLTVAWTSAASAGEEPWKEYQAEHFIIFYQHVPFDFVQAVAQSAEGYYGEITDNLGLTRYRNWIFGQRASIYIYDDKEDYLKSARQASWSHGVAYARSKVIRTFPSDYGFFDSILPHEMGHLIFREFIGFRSPDVPRWVDEGVAMFQEKAKRWGASRVVKRAIADGTFIPLSKLSRMDPGQDTPRETVNLFYAEAASVIYYLIVDQGKYRFVDFCQLLRSGKTFEQALSTAYARFRSLKALNRAWVDYVEDQP